MLFRSHLTVYSRSFFVVWPPRRTCSGAAEGTADQSVICHATAKAGSSPWKRCQARNNSLRICEIRPCETRNRLAAAVVVSPLARKVAIFPQAARQKLQPGRRNRCGRWPSRRARRACPRPGFSAQPPPPNRNDRAARPGGSFSAGSSRSKTSRQFSLPPTFRPSLVWDTPNRASTLGKATSVLPNSTSRA